MKNSPPESHAQAHCPSNQGNPSRRVCRIIHAVAVAWAFFIGAMAEGAWQQITQPSVVDSVTEVYGKSGSTYLVGLTSGQLAWIDSSMSQIQKTIALPNGVLTTNASVAVDEGGNIVVAYKQGLLLSQDGGTSWTKSKFFTSTGFDDLPGTGLRIKRAATGQIIAFPAGRYQSSTVFVYVLAISNGTITVTAATQTPFSFDNNTSNIEDAQLLPGGDVIVTEYSFKIHRYTAASNSWDTVSTQQFFFSTPSAITFYKGHIYIGTYWSGFWELQGSALVAPNWGLPSGHGGLILSVVGDDLLAFLADAAGTDGAYLVGTGGPASRLSISDAGLDQTQFWTFWGDETGTVVVKTALGLMSEYNAQLKAFVNLNAPTYVPQSIWQIARANNRLYALDGYGVIHESNDDGTKWAITTLTGLEFSTGHGFGVQWIYGDPKDGLFASPYSPFTVFTLGTNGWTRTFDGSYPNTLTYLRTVSGSAGSFIFAGTYAGGVAVIDRTNRSIQRINQSAGSALDFDRFRSNSALVLFQNYPNPITFSRVYVDGRVEPIPLPPGCVPLDVASTGLQDAAGLLCSDGGSGRFLAIVAQDPGGAAQVTKTVPLPSSSINSVSTGGPTQLYLHSASTNYLYNVTANSVVTLNSQVESHDNIVASARYLFTVQNGKLMRENVGALGNISTRLNVGTGDNALIGGFIITGTLPKKVIVRGIGPSLASFGLSGVLADPVLELHDSSQVISTNNDWQTNANKQEMIDRNVAPSNPKEAAILTTLNPGPYTAILSGANNGTGIGTVEVYDLDQTVDSKLANISTRGFVDTGDNVMIGGTIVTGGTSTNVLIRAIGPSLTNVGVPNPLQDPTLELHNAQGGVIATNDDWVDSSDAGAISATTLQPTNSHESAILQNLPPGAYTAIVRANGNSTGVALVEAYQLQ